MSESQIKKKYIYRQNGINLPVKQIKNKQTFKADQTKQSLGAS